MSRVEQIPGVMGYIFRNRILRILYLTILASVFLLTLVEATREVIRLFFY